MNRIIKALSCLIMLSALVSCNEGMNTIFDNAINDSLINDSSLDNTLTVFGMVRLGTNYYIAAGKIYTRDVAGGSWSSFQLANAIHQTIATDGATYLYVSAVAGSGNSTLLAYDPSAPISGSNPVTVNCGATTDHIIKVKNFGAAPPYSVYAAVQDNDSTCSLYSISGTTASQVGWTASCPDFITDFSFGDALIITAGSHVYVGSQLTDAAPVATYTYNGVRQFDGSVYLSAEQGALFKSVNTTPGDGTIATWPDQNIGYTYDKGGTSYTVRFTEFQGISGAPGRLFVGTRGAGFYEIPGVDFPNTIRFQLTSKAELYNGAVESIFVDSTTIPNPTVFFCTYSAGLWSDTYTLGPPPSWDDNWSR